MLQLHQLDTIYFVTLLNKNVPFALVAWVHFYYRTL